MCCRALPSRSGSVVWQGWDVKRAVLMQDLNAMIDAAKYADLVLLLVDGAFGFEMETFEFLNILQVCFPWLSDRDGLVGHLPRARACVEP